MLNGISLGIMTIIGLLTVGFVLTLLINRFLIPLLKTPKEVITEIVDIMQLEKEDHLVDLGSGDGRLLLRAYANSKCICTGYDISPIMMIIARTKKALQFPLSKNFFLEPEDIFKIDLEKFTKIYCYLDEKSLEILKSKLREFVKSGGEVYSYRSRPMPRRCLFLRLTKNNKPLYIYKNI